MDRLSQTIVCILDILRGRSISERDLTNFLFLVDVQAVRSVGRSISGVTWRRYQYGPHSERLSAACDIMRRAGLLLEDTAGYRPVTDAVEIAKSGINDLEYAVIHATVTKRIDADSAALAAEACGTEPMRSVEEAERDRGKRLDGSDLDMTSIQRSVFAVEP